MELHNIDEYLDLQDQNEINLLSAEGITPIQSESEWHSVTGTPTDSILNNNDNFLYGTENNNSSGHSNNRNNNDSNWGFGLNFNFINNSDLVPNFITPDSLLKQPQEQRVTRSRSTGSLPIVTTTYKKKKATKSKKLYCICQQPYNGKPMVQCDHCEDWFHCTCVNFEPDEQEEDIDWICDGCKELKKSSNQDAAKTQDSTEDPIKVQSSQEPVVEARQTRQKQASTCLYSECNNHTRADSYCSDVCARKNEKTIPRRRTKSLSVVKEEQSDEYVEEKEKTPVVEERTENEDCLEVNSPSAMTVEENPVRRNVIKNMSAVLKTIMENALQKDPDVFENTEQPVPERAESLSRSIESTMLEQLGDRGTRQRTCGEPYKIKFRSLYHNLKDKANQMFQLRVVTGDLTPLELVKMSSEDMANPELKSKSEVLRQKSLKNSILKLENMPIIKKTHKGDIIMIPNKENDHTSYQEQVSPIVVKQQVESPTETSSVESKQSTGPKDDILARIGIQDNQKRDASHLDGNRIKKRKVTVDVEELLGDEETPFEIEQVDDMEDPEIPEKEDEPMQDIRKESHLPSIWKGRVNMPQVAEFEACARQIGGRQLTEQEWAEVLSPTMWIEGRIPAERVTSYITQTQYSSSREIVLIQVEGENRQTEVYMNKEQTQTLLNYLETRQRYAVVGHNKTQIKDFYLIPLKRHQNIPDCLYVVRVEESSRDCDLFLGVLVLQKTKGQAYNPY